MSRGRPVQQSVENIVAFSDRLTSCALALRVAADEMRSRGIDSVRVLEGHRMAYLAVEQYLEKFVQEVRKALTREMNDRGEFGGQ